MNYHLIPTYKIQGAAISTVFTEFFIFMLTSFFVIRSLSKNNKLKINLWKFKQNCKFLNVLLLLIYVKIIF